MTNREDTYKKALSIKQNALAQKKAQRENKLRILTENEPKISDIDRRLSALGAEIALTALSSDLEKLAFLQKETTALSNERAELFRASGIEDIVYDCPLCCDTGYAGGKICDCVHTIAKGLRVKELSQEFPINECRFDNFDLNYYPAEETDGINPRKKMTQILKLCREYVINFTPTGADNLLFMGSAGLGKTHLSLAMVSELTEKGYDVIYGSAYNLFSAMENEHFSYKRNDSYTAAVNCDLLVIDDLGSEFVNPYIQTLLYNIVNTRLLAKKPMIINTNIGMQEIENRYTPRISSRLLGNFTARRFVGRDIRQIKMLEKHG